MRAFVLLQREHLNFASRTYLLLPWRISEISALPSAARQAGHQLVGRGDWVARPSAPARGRLVGLPSRAPFARLDAGTFEGFHAQIQH
jgi:hypothetical protein